MEKNVNKSRLIIYDTSNFIDFPIGGQLTSVSNFLKFLSEEHAEQMERIVLVGVTSVESMLGEMTQISIHGFNVCFMPVAVTETNLGHTAHSLRLSYAKGILKYGKKLGITPQDCNYIQTPEAAGPIRFLCHKAQIAVFSHGSYANMERGFRFFKKNILIKKAFLAYLKWVIKKADVIFVIDEASRKDYLSYNSKLIKAGNSCVLPDDYDSWRPHEYEGRLLFAGRLSIDKGVAGIIRAMAKLPEGEHLLIVGDGEERSAYEKLADEVTDEVTKTGEFASANDNEFKSNFIKFEGAVKPFEVAGYMKNADILIMNSAFEGVPMTILEALSNGLPVITTAVGGIPETVVFGEDSVRTEGDPDSIADAVHEIKNNYSKYSENAHKHAQDYSYKIVNSRIYEGLSKLWK